MKDLPTALDPRNEHDEARAESAALAAFGRKVDITLDLQRGADQNGVRPGRRRLSSECEVPRLRSLETANSPHARNGGSHSSGNTAFVVDEGNVSISHAATGDHELFPGTRAMPV